MVVLRKMWKKRLYHSVREVESESQPTATPFQKPTPTGKFGSSVNLVVDKRSCSLMVVSLDLDWISYLLTLVCLIVCLLRADMFLIVSSSCKCRTGNRITNGCRVIHLLDGTEQVCQII